VSLVFEVDLARPDEAEPGMAAAEEAVAGGSLVVFPTETVYGLACRPDDPDATDRLFQAKQRPLDLNLPLLVASAGAAWEVAEPSDAARALASAFWPGPITLVLPRTERSRPWHLGEAADTVAVRVPDHPLCLALLGRTGHLATTSANLSGRPPLLDPDQLVSAFDRAVAVYLLLAPGVSPPSGSASTVVDLTSGRPLLTRRGAVTLDAVTRALAAERG
jgi:tRNA threonylcarbamoyl adenosine modification protein (Sua5/YciO/YrdC/YwlC family)